MHLPLRSRTLSSLLPLTLLLLLLTAFSGSNPPPSGHRPKATYDPIRFSLWADRNTVAVGQVFTLTMTATYQPVSSALLETFEPAAVFRLKLLYPEGFVPTGGDYHELIGTELSAARPSVTYQLTGYFVFRPASPTFRLLRGPGSATSASLFVEATRLTLRLSPSSEPASPALTDARGRRLAGNFEGHLDGADCGSIGGWVYDRDQPHIPLMVELLVNGQVVASQWAGNFRQDLLNAGKGDGRHGFGFETPAAIKTGQPVSVSVRVAASGYSLIGSPKTVTCAGSAPPPTSSSPAPANPSGGAYEGFLDGADCGSIGGWVYDRHQPDAPLTVEVLANGQVVATVPAATYRADLQNAGKGNGRHGFSLEPPANLKTGQPQTISVRVAGTGFSLTNSPRTITCAGSGSSTPSPPTNPPPSTSTNPLGGNYEGFFEGADCGSVGGWVYDRNSPNTPLTVELLANGQMVAGGLAGNFRQDLLTAGKGDGRHGLSLPLPESVRTGQNLSLQLRVAGSTYLLMNGPRTINCGSGTTTGSTTTPSGGCQGNGLTGLYFNTDNLSGTPVLARTDAGINFSWGGSPAEGKVNADRFSVHWRGQIEAPVTGTYVFRTYNDDATRLTIQGRRLIDDWQGHPPTWQQGTIYLEAGRRYDIRLDFAEFMGGAQAQLYWQYPGQGQQLVPACRLYGLSMGSDPLASQSEIIYRMVVDDCTFWVDERGAVDHYWCYNRGAGSSGTGAWGPGLSNPGSGGPGAGNPPPGFRPEGGDTGTPGSNPTFGNGQRTPTTAFLDAVDCQQVRGWAYATNGGYAYVDIYVNSRKVATVLANNDPRPDVRAAKGGNTGIPLNCGFKWLIQEELKSSLGAGERLTVNVVPVNDLTPIENSPRTTSNECKKAETPIGPTNPTGPTEPSTLTQTRLKLASDKMSFVKPCDVSDWKPLADFSPPSAVMQRLNLLKPFHPYLNIYDWKLQTLETASGNLINCDYFGVNIRKFPDGFTAERLLEHIRKNINNFVDTELSAFYPHPNLVDETRKWLNAPLGSVLLIDIPGDDGSVICSDFATDHWTFSTITDPNKIGDNLFPVGQHPVSGNRLFGFTKNSNGSFSFYTRGVDRLTGQLDELLGSSLSQIQFRQADKLWRSFQARLTNFVNLNGGEAVYEPEIKKRPKWDQLKAVWRGELSPLLLECE
ncbi:PA14 domain-containing protein [Larkinella soli]|uniref:PA14 domain-containing protein n=1 Tax=Larkinella soli TaxID=1770527 RepID=UPI000FFBC68B|nr:PA14 domain-containing protein [Larkinella soli]